MWTFSIIFCGHFTKDAEVFPKAVLQNESRGQEFFETVSKQAWQEWLKHQTTLINEKRLNVFEPDAKKFLEE
ncbi:oxidative damage protection protein, partial [Acinetobacter junii]|uniref:oxidative damage protection protein n=1 Tax=Acinetobacter junii TaxID=40215 RepID=UPI0023577BC2